MHTRLLTYRSAAVFALAITLLLHLFFLIMFLFGRDAVMPPDVPQRPEHHMDFARFSASFIANFIFTFALCALNFTILRSALKRKVAIVVLCSLVCAFLLSYLSSNILLSFFPAEHPARMIRGGLMRDLFIAVITVFTSQIIYLSYKKQQIVLENKSLLAENVRSRYESLKQQTDPHFLFNSLNTLNSIIPEDPVRAQEYVQKLSAVFRYILQSKEVITLEEELHFTRDYCSLMQIRYGESLQFHFDISETYNRFLIVPLSIQTLVENAIKHNVITNRQPLTVSIYSSDAQTVTVSNPLQPKKVAEAGEGIGLSNLTERYRLKWAKEIVVQQTDRIFSVTLPLIGESYVKRSYEL